MAHLGGDDGDVPCFRKATIGEVFKLNLDTDMRVSEGALHLSSEYLRLFAIELFHRSVEWAKIEQEDADAEREREGLAKSKELQLKATHLEQVITGVILDF